MVGWPFGCYPTQCTPMYPNPMYSNRTSVFCACAQLEGSPLLSVREYKLRSTHQNRQLLSYSRRVQTCSFLTTSPRFYFTTFLFHDIFILNPHLKMSSEC